MKQIQCVGAGFDPSQSSCSNLKPQSFSWTTEPAENQVLIDNAILYANKIDRLDSQKSYGWVCESSAIVPQLIEALKDFHEVIIEDGELEAIFTNDKSLLELSDNFIYCSNGSNFPWIPAESWGIGEKNKLCSMVASPKVMCDGHHYRQKIACKFKDKIDLFGGACGSERIGISANLDQEWNDKRIAVCPYKFSIVMENISSDNYFTEKLTDCFATGTVPIYWGAKNIGNFFDSKGIIKLDDDFNVDILTDDLYNKMIPHIEENYKKIKSMEMSDDELAKKIM